MVTRARMRTLVTVAVFALATGWSGWLAWSGAGLGHACAPPSLVQESPACLSGAARISAWVGAAIYASAFGAMAAGSLGLMFTTARGRRLFGIARAVALGATLAAAGSTIVAANAGWNAEALGGIEQAKAFARLLPVAIAAMVVWAASVLAIRPKRRTS